jgi:glucose-1-phosphate cytidylyltransferase
MKAMILAGGLGSRLSEETVVRPKPMVEIGGHPMLWHIMKIYSSYGINDFVICLGYKGYLIKEYFSQYLLHTSDVTIDLQNNRIDFHARRSEPWRVTLVETGAETETGGRIRRALAISISASSSRSIVRMARWRRSPACARLGGSEACSCKTPS